MGFAGGFTLGVVQAGFELVGKRELPGGFGVPNCEVNRALLGDSWETQVGPGTSWDTAPASFVFGNPPCSAWSVMTAKNSRGIDAKVTSCMWDFVRYAARVKPQVAVFESVQQAFRNPDGHALMRALREELETLTGEQWSLTHVLHNALSVGGAAMRKRYFWVASRVPFGVEPEQLDHVPCLNDIIDDLEQLPLAWEKQSYPSYKDVRVSRWVEREHARSRTGLVDGHITISNIGVGRLNDLMDAVPWNPGESYSDVLRRHWDTYARLPESFSSLEEKIVKNDFAVGFTAPFRWVGENHARVITGASLGTVIHPRLNRVITHREAARILGFPDDWQIEPLRGSNFGATWGKGITVQCGRWIAKWVRHALDSNPGSVVGDDIGDRERVIDLTHDWKNAGTRSSVNFDTINTSTPSSTRKEQHMTEPQPTPQFTQPETPAPEAVAPAATEGSEGDQKRGRGRPRPTSTLERDKKVLAVVNDEMSREDIAAQLQDDTGNPMKASHVYLSLYRLRQAGLVTRQRNSAGKHVWVRTDGAVATGTTTSAADAPTPAATA